MTKNASRAKLPNSRPYLRVANVYSNRLDLDEVLEIGITDQEHERVRLAKGNLLIVEGNGSLDQIGRVAIWDGTIEGCVHQNHLIRARAYDSIRPKFLLYFLVSSAGRTLIQRVASSTSGLHTLSLSKVEALCVPVCSIAEQDEVVQRLDTEFSHLDELESDIRNALGHAELLRQSILKKAFSGQLIPQDPTDEPASMLIERIRAKKAANSNNGTTRRKARRA